jgi:hypothetical protein
MMKDRLTHEEAVLLLSQCQEIILERDAEIDHLRSALLGIHDNPDTARMKAAAALTPNNRS